MKLIFKLKTPDGEYRTDECDAFTLCNVDFTRTHDKNGYSVLFVPQTDVILSYFSLCFRFDCELVYDAGSCTNAFARIRSASEEFFSRDIFMCEGKDCLRIGITGFDRFYTCFYYRNGELELRFNLENKTVYAGKVYTLESYMCESDTDAYGFFLRYAGCLGERYGKTDKPVGAGWSSWSCFYGNISEERVEKQARLLADKVTKLGADLIQLDDGWQREGSFGCWWDEEKTRFPSMKDCAEKLKGLGIDFGIWMAPGLICDTSSRFDSIVSHIVKENGRQRASFGGAETLAYEKNGSVYPLNLDDDFTLEHTREMFTRGVNEFGAVYFKIDFLVNLLHRAGRDNSPVIYGEDYSVALYRRFIKVIRETVGNDVFLLACGAPVGESAGVFDAIRSTPDITWGGYTPERRPTPWEILTMNVQNMILRSAYHGNAFICDPDGLVLRDYFSYDANDGLMLSDDEAFLLSAAVASSGGTLLLNEDIGRLPKERLAMFEDIIPPLGIAAAPADFFEYPYCTHSVINADSITQIHFFYNFTDKQTAHSLNADGCYAVDCRTKVPIKDESVDFVLQPHSCRALYLRKKLGVPQIAYCDENLYLGAGSVKAEYTDGVLNIQTFLSRPCKIFADTMGCEVKINQNGAAGSLILI